MKIHDSAIVELIKVFQIYGGHRSEERLKSELRKIDWSIYTQNTGNDVLVLTDDLKKAVLKKQN